MSDNQKRLTRRSKGISRRRFIIGTAIGVAGAAALGSGVTVLLAPSKTTMQPSTIPSNWDLAADVVVVGGGATGLPAAIKAVTSGASVILVEANYDVGGHAITSGGNVALGGGTAAQQKYNITDSSDQIFLDLTDWSVVEANGAPDYRYNDRAIIRAFADNNVATYNLLVDSGVKFVDRPPDAAGGQSVGNSAPRENHAVWGRGVSAESPSGSNGTAFIRPLEATARAKGVQFLLNYHMDSIVRENQFSGRVLGITATYRPRRLLGSNTNLASYANQGNINMTQATVNVGARKAVIVATGGHSSNVDFRRIFDPRLNSEYQVAGEPYSFQDASGELAAMAIGASLWGTMGQTTETGISITKPAQIGCKYGYSGLKWLPNSPIFAFAGASGLTVTNYQDVIMVNQTGQRFYDETQGQFMANNYGSIKPYRVGSYLNAANIKYAPQNYLNAAMALNSGSAPPDYGAGPIWAIFDSDAVTREKWDVGAPNTDPAYFYSATTLSALAAALGANPYQKVPMSSDTLHDTVARYNSFVDSETYLDFGKPTPKYKIETPPFYAAWATPVIHDSRSGLRINAKCQVIDNYGQIIQGLYCGGESAGGFNEHGLARAVVQGYIAGQNAVAEPTT
jgi:hypothetical protein